MEFPLLTALSLILATAFLCTMIFTWNRKDNKTFALKMGLAISLMTINVMQPNWFLAVLWGCLTLIYLLQLAFEF